MSVMLEWDGYRDRGRGGGDARPGLADRAGLRRARARATPTRCAGPEPAGAGRPAAAARPPTRSSAPSACTGDAELAQGFAVLVVLDGEGTLAHGRRRSARAAAAATPCSIPWAAGPARLHGDLVAIACRPPEQEDA